ncbi:unnamed protein product [marine sediment metagenome]|uniref:Uncharacterized protein n=1 Tax=marine sediment metagenome TaxID=412755 RepID=X1GGK9_9ZZZZ
MFVEDMILLVSQVDTSKTVTAVITILAEEYIRRILTIYREKGTEASDTIGTLVTEF